MCWSTVSFWDGFSSRIFLNARYYYILINWFLLKKKETNTFPTQGWMQNRSGVPRTRPQLWLGSANSGASHPSCSIFYIFHMEISYREFCPFNVTKKAGNGRNTNVLHCKLSQKSRDKYPYALMTEGIFHSINYRIKGRWVHSTICIHLADNIYLAIINGWIWS